MKNTAIILLAALTLTACKVGIPENFDLGKVENNVYTNTFFNMTMDVPEGWVVQEQEAFDKLMDSGRKDFVGDDKQLNAATKIGEFKTANMLMASKFPLDSIVLENPNILMLVENLTVNPTVKTGKDYLKASKDILNKGTVNIKNISETFEKVTINGNDFYTMDVLLSNGFMDINQRYYTIVKNRFCIVTVITYIREETGNDLEKYIESIKFGK